MACGPRWITAHSCSEDYVNRWMFIKAVKEGVRGVSIFYKNQHMDQDEMQLYTKTEAHGYWGEFDDTKVVSESTKIILPLLPVWELGFSVNCAFRYLKNYLPLCSMLNDEKTKFIF